MESIHDAPGGVWHRTTSHGRRRHSLCRARLPVSGSPTLSAASITDSIGSEDVGDCCCSEMHPGELVLRSGLDVRRSDGLGSSWRLHFVVLDFQLDRSSRSSIKNSDASSKAPREKRRRGAFFQLQKSRVRPRLASSTFHIRNIE